MGTRTNPFADCWSYFRSHISDHVLEVVHDDGVYRHVVMGKPGTSIWSWSIVTWPGHLAVSGDIGDGFMFARERDMVGFFAAGLGTCGDGGPRINPGYWAEKLQGPCRSGAFEFSEKKFMAEVRGTVAEHIESEGLSGEAAAELEKVIEDAEWYSGDKHAALDWAYNHDRQDLFGMDFIESGFDDFDVHFLYACFAIAVTVREYLNEGK